MRTRHKAYFGSFPVALLFLAGLSLCLFLNGCRSEKVESVSTDAAMTQVQAQEEKDLKELKNQIRREKFDLILPQVMRKHNIDMWIHVMRETLPDSFGAEDLGSISGVFIFTDRGGDRIERAILERRWRDAEWGGPSSDPKLVEECGAYDIIGEAIDRTEMPGGPKTEFDYRFNGVREFVAERDPKRIAVNYLETLGPHVGASSKDGLSHTDYILLAKALGDNYARRIVSSEYLLYDFVSRPVASELVLLKKMRKFITEAHERDWARIVPGVTKFDDLESVHSVVDKNGKRTGFAAFLDPDASNATLRIRDYVIQRGDLIQLRLGYERGSSELKSKFGNFYEHIDELGYVLLEGETEPPPHIKRAWADVMKIHKVLEENIKMGRTGRETYEILKQKLKEAGVIVIETQEYFKDLDPDKPQVNLDLHAAGQGSSTYFPAPRIGTYGPDWHHDMMIPLNHHFYYEYFVFIPMPEWGEGKHLLIQMHDGAIVTERGVEYLSPPPQELRIIR